MLHTYFIQPGAAHLIFFSLNKRKTIRIGIFGDKFVQAKPETVYKIRLLGHMGCEPSKFRRGLSLTMSPPTDPLGTAVPPPLPTATTASRPACTCRLPRCRHQREAFPSSSSPSARKRVRPGHVIAFSAPSDRDQFQERKGNPPTCLTGNSNSTGHGAQVVVAFLFLSVRHRVPPPPVSRSLPDGGGNPSRRIRRRRRDYARRGGAGAEGRDARGGARQAQVSSHLPSPWLAVDWGDSARAFSAGVMSGRASSEKGENACSCCFFYRVVNR